MMKKFSNLEEKENIQKTQPSKLEKTIEKYIKENLTISIVGDSYTGKVLNIGGKSEFITEFLKIVENQKETNDILVKESIKNQSQNFFDQKSINEQLEKLYEMYDEMVIAPAPEDIFNSEDYDMNMDTLILKSLNVVPQDYLDYINKGVSDKYFLNGNTVRILHSDKGWHLFFIPSLRAHSDNYNDFIIYNKEFISDFIKATERLIGANNLNIDPKLISNVR